MSPHRTHAPLPRPTAGRGVAATVALSLLLSGTTLATGSVAAHAAPADDPGDLSTSFEADDGPLDWTSTPEETAGGPRVDGVVGTSVLERSPSTTTGDDVLGAATDELAWEGPFQNGVGKVDGTLEDATTPDGDPAQRWAMAARGETWVQVPVPDLERGVTMRAEATLTGTGKVFLNVYSGGSDVGGTYVTLSDEPQTVTVDLARPASGGGTPQFQIRTHDAAAVDVTISGTSVRRLEPGTVDFPGDVADHVTKVTASKENAPDETADKLADGDVTTKWLAGARTAQITYELDEPTTVKAYALSSANDSPGRDPRAWELQGSADGTSWTTLDPRGNQTFSERFQTRGYTVAEPGEYRFYRLDITSNSGSDGTQLAELQLATEPLASTSMTAEVGSGPSAAYNAPSQVGWTGVGALHYAGSQTTDGRGFAYAKVLDVDVPVGADTELSYVIFPEASENDLEYASTFAAVDLAFTDGTYLSDLAAVDEHGAIVSPQGQGEAKTLFTNQWNSVASHIGEVAAGKTIDRVLVGYDNPDGPGDFSGWIDDVAVTGEPERPTAEHPSDYVVTTRGTNSSGDFSRGNNIPATAVPHGFNFWTPVTDAGTNRWLYQYQKGNDEQNRPSIQAFSLSHEPSPWMGDRQTFQVMPSAATGTPDANRSRRALTFSHGAEVARAHYYGVTFDNGMQTEIAPTDHAAMFRFTFTGDESNLVFDNVNDAGGLSLDAETGVVSGYTDVSTPGSSAGMTRMFVYGTVDRPVTGSGSLTGGGGDGVTGYLKFDTSEDKVVTLRLATSLMSVEQAQHNLDLEISADDTFDTVEDRAQDLWDDALDVIEVEGADHDTLVSLYSNLYRLNLYPNSGYENTGTAADPEYRHVVQSSASGDPAPQGTTATETGARVEDGKVFVNNGFWDTYRTAWPAYSLLYPTEAGEMVNGFVQQYDDGGWVSRWSAPGYADSMTGTSSDVAFADAYLKDVPGIDVQAAYDAALKNASTAPPNASVGRKGLDPATFLGYTPTSTHESASWSLEDYLNDYGIATMSKKLLDTSAEDDPRHQEYADNYEYYLNRALNYSTLFDPTAGFLRGREEDGSWSQSAADFDPEVWGNEFTETDGWNFAFHAVQDGQGLANLYGGTDALGAKLDEFFATPETASKPGSYGGVIHEMREAKAIRQGQWGLSNQVSHHIPYMYAFAGEPAKTAEAVRTAMARSFTGNDIGQGYPGDEDNGEMSAWWLFSALGFYPLQMGSPTYVIGSPLFTHATIHLENGEDLVIDAPDNSAENIYVQGVTVNGVEQSATYLTHDQLADGGTIELDMGPTPSDWGTGEDDAPPSITQGADLPDPLADVTGSGTVTVDKDGADGAALFDDTSSTELAVGSASVAYELTGTTARARMYTLTSAAADGADPTAWTLEGSTDGETWTTLDERTGQSFANRRETRAFSIADPQVYRYYRLHVTGSTGGAATLSEVELLAHTPKVGELADALDAGRIPAGTAERLGAIVDAAQDAEDAHDAAGVVAQVRALRVAVDTTVASQLDDETRAELTLLVSQWLTASTGLDEIRAQVGALQRSGDVADATAQTLLDLVETAQEQLDGAHADALAETLATLRRTVADATEGQVSDHAREVLLPLVDALVENPPAVQRAASAASTLMGDYDPEKAWWPSSWWNSAVATHTVIDYMSRTGDLSYLEQVDRTFERNKAPFPAGEMSGDELLGNFTSRAIDDSAWWGLAWVSAYDLTGDQKYLDMAVTIGDYVHGYWDESTCGGGVWWDGERTYKNAVTNGLYVRLTAELHNRIDGDTTWLERSQTGWDWLTESGMINADGLVNDGLTGDCRNNGGTVWSYNQGLAIGAGLELHRATGDAEPLETAERLADAALASDVLVSDGVLTESCDALDATCDDNGKQFKGVFMRYFMDLNDTTGSDEYQEFVDRQAATIWSQDRTAGDRLGVRWAGGESAQHPNVFDWRTQASALSALLAATPQAPQVRVDVQARCLAGKGYVAVRATNAGAEPLDVAVTTPFGEKSFAAVAGGKNGYQSFAVRASGVEAGSVTVSAVPAGGGQRVTQEVTYSAKTC
ncbi:GH92 family glycosyl hydrolase [Cellulosimicrobium arenosum]|uniref:GH92 family glycosyl hydrolase n=1 Tax=Cellulosimicrobium arenosum TaxID=2708133 RepID=A0A927G9K8_9MICO|nr:GH92 family glycosyl hydrolase [Cellulosimicrobium arenosum]MBD8079084.1 GH92 family glycosyl hydrolase [Cellulosimicrobium arenosum]